MRKQAASAKMELLYQPLKPKGTLFLHGQHKSSFAPRNLVVGTAGTGMMRGKPYLTTDSKAEITKHIGQEIQYYRKKAEYTQDDLAKKIGKVRRTIRKYKKGDNAVPVPALNEISKVLNTPLLALTGHRGCPRLRGISKA